tara:strand:- start:102 stop:674 length:573 start_codon:yes stop_codon:yes gene_type:complete
MSFNSTLGSKDATSYIPVATADTIFSNSLQNTDWAALSTAQKQAALMASTQSLEVLSYLGDRCSPSTDDSTAEQRLQWPRENASCKGVKTTADAIPLPVRIACSQLALALHKDSTALIGDGANNDTKGGLKAQQLGELKQEFYDVKEGASIKVDASGPIVLQKFPWIVDVLNCWLVGSYGASKVLLRVRS